MLYMSNVFIDIEWPLQTYCQEERFENGSTMNGDVRTLTSFPALEPRKDEGGVVFADDREDGIVNLGANMADKMDGVDYYSSSRPPSPPDSGTTTPTTTIAPCPKRLRPFYPPPNYGTVELHNIYRSSFPHDRHMDFVKILKIRTVLCLVDTEPTAGYQDWVHESQIKCKNVEIKPNKDGNINTTLESLCEALLFMLNSSNYPIYIHCNQGKHRTGCVTACLRRIQRVPIDEVITEYVAYSWPKQRTGDIDLIKSFDPDNVFEYAKTHGYLDGPQPVLKRQDSGITNIDALAEALLSGAAGGDDSTSACTSPEWISSARSATSSSASDGALEMSLSHRAAPILGEQAGSLDVHFTEVAYDAAMTDGGRASKVARTDAGKESTAMRIPVECPMLSKTHVAATEYSS